MTESWSKLRIPRPRNPLSGPASRPRPARPAGLAMEPAAGPSTGEQLAGLAVLAAIAAQQDMARRAESAMASAAAVPRGPVPLGAVPYGEAPRSQAPRAEARHGHRGGDQLAGFLAEIDAARRED
jgi:hypothetical protein